MNTGQFNLFDKAVFSFNLLSVFVRQLPAQCLLLYKFGNFKVGYNEKNKGNMSNQSPIALLFAISAKYCKKCSTIYLTITAPALLPNSALASTITDRIQSSIQVIRIRKNIVGQFLLFIFNP